MIWTNVNTIVVHFIAALPLAWLIASLVTSRLRWTAALASGTVFFAAGLGLLTVTHPTSLSMITGVFVRSTTTILFSVSGACILSGISGLQSGTESFLQRLCRSLKFSSGRSDPKTFATLGLAAVLLPAIFTSARCRKESDHLQDLIEQSRFGEARELARQLLRLQPGLKLGKTSLENIEAELSQIVAELKSALAHPPVLNDAQAEGLDRIRRLAMLGRADEALREIGRLQNLDLQACNLCGTIYETRHEWASAREWYRRGHRASQTLQPGPLQRSGQLQALQGIAYCERKSGRYRNADTAYRQILAISPTADSHFLIAQFYEDTQQTSLAREHALRAIALNPVQYREAGERLLNRLATRHFGCFTGLR